MPDTPFSQALASRARRRVIDDATQGLGSTRGAHLSIRGGRFRLINANGMEKLVETHFIDTIIIDANDKPARVYFEGAFDPAADLPPTCYSDNGSGPSNNAMAPQAPTCAECQWAMRGTKTTFTGKPAAACESRKKLAFIIPDDSALNVYEFQIPPGSITNFRKYCDWLSQQDSGMGRPLDVADVVTRVSFDRDKQFVMVFEAKEFADDDRTLQVIQHIDENHLSDVAVGRNDVACPPDRVRAMMAGRALETAVPAPQVGQTRSEVPAAQSRPALAAAHDNGAARALTPRKPRSPGQALPGPAVAAAPVAAEARKQGQEAAQTGDIPDFLKRKNTAPEPGGVTAAPRFGVGEANPPPTEISEALSKAMALGTRRT